MYYIRIYHNIVKTKDSNETIDSPSMALSTSTSEQGHQVEVLLHLVDPLSMESHHFFVIFILIKNNRNAG
jgi:hypothetical protein